MSPTVLLPPKSLAVIRPAVDPGWILRERFKGSGALPVVRGCVPGPGYFAATQADGSFTLGGNVLTVAGQATLTHGDLQLLAGTPEYSTAIPRSIAPTLAAIVQADAMDASDGYIGVGWYSGTVLGPATRLLESTQTAYTGGGFDGTYVAVNGSGPFGQLETGMRYTHYAQANAGTGGSVFVEIEGLSGALLGGIVQGGSDATLYGGLCFGETDAVVYRATLWPGAVYEPLRMLNEASPALNTTYDTGYADVLLDFGVSFGSLTAGQYLDALYHYQDSDNHWRLRFVVNGGGTAVDAELYDVVAGTATLQQTETNVLVGAGTIYVSLATFTLTGSLWTTRRATQAAVSGQSMIGHAGSADFDTATGVRFERSGVPTVANLQAWKLWPYFPVQST